MTALRLEQELRRLSERCRDAWAITRAVGRLDAEAALARHHRTRILDEDTPDEEFYGTADGLPEDLLAAAEALSLQAESLAELRRLV